MIKQAIITNNKYTLQDSKAYDQHKTWEPNATKWNNHIRSEYMIILAREQAQVRTRSASSKYKSCSSFHQYKAYYNQETKWKRDDKSYNRPLVASINQSQKDLSYHLHHQERIQVTN